MVGGDEGELRFGGPFLKSLVRGGEAWVHERTPKIRHVCYSQRQR